MINQDYTALSITGTGAQASMNVGHVDELWAHVYGTFTGTLTLEVSQDGTNWTAINFQTFQAATSPGTFVPNVTAPAVVKADVCGLAFARFNCTVFSAGPISVKSSGAIRGK